MALYYNLPIYKASYELVILLFSASKDFAREYKYTVGERLKNEGMDLIIDIYRANKAIDKVPAISSAREKVEMIRLQLRLTRDAGQMSLKKFVQINLVIEEVSRQLTNWEKYSLSRKLKINAPESPVARARASVRSKSNNPLVS